MSGPLAMLLRLDSVRNDGVGWLATFYGKPDVKGNSFEVPISDEQAREIAVGQQYLFVCVELKKRTTQEG